MLIVICCVGTLTANLLPTVCSPTTTATQAFVDFMAKNSYLAVMSEGLMNAAAQGLISGISGGDVGQGFVSGMLSSVVSSVNMSIGLSGTAGDISTMLFGSVSGGLGATLTGGNFWQGAATGLTVSALNHVAHKMNGQGNDPKPKKKIIGNTKEAVDHYYNGNGEEVELSMGTKKKLFSSPENKYVVRRLINGEAVNLSSTFDVDLTNSYETFHVGDTNVDYSTTCTTGKCTTTFKAFVRDGFSDPLDIGIELGGKPYNYVPWVYSLSYKNPGYPVGSNIKVNTNR